MSVAQGIQIKSSVTHPALLAIHSLLLTLISSSAIDSQDPRFVIQRHMVFISPDMPTITGADYASLICDQFDFQVLEATLKITGKCSFSIVIIESAATPRNSSC